MRISCQWLDRLDSLLKAKRSTSLLSKISGEDAAKEILTSNYKDLAHVGFDEVEGKRLGVSRGMKIAIYPDDTGLRSTLPFS